MGIIREDAHLTTGIGPRITTQFMKGDGQQRNGDLLTRGNQNIHLSSTGLGLDLFGQPNQAIGFATHGRNHHHHAITTIAESVDFLSDRLNTLYGADRCATVFLNNQTHDNSTVLAAGNGRQLNTK